MIAGAVLLAASLAMAPTLREKIASAAGMMASAFPERETQEAIVVLPEMEVFALQLGVFDSGERAEKEMNRLMAQGIPCLIWQREQMRIICSAAKNRENLDEAVAGGLETCVISETLPAVSLRMTADAQDLDAARGMLLLPDSLLDRLLGLEGGELAALVGQTREEAAAAEGAHPENELYTQLAGSLFSWCDLMDDAMAAYGEARALTFAQASMCTLCRQLRLMLAA